MSHSQLSEQSLLDVRFVKTTTEIVDKQARPQKYDLRMANAHFEDYGQITIYFLEFVLEGRSPKGELVWHATITISLSFQCALNKRPSDGMVCTIAIPYILSDIDQLASRMGMPQPRLTAQLCRAEGV